MANYKTMQIWVKKGHRMHGYFREMCHNAKNLHNTTNFYIRQVFTGLTQEKERQPLQREVLDAIQNHLPKMNDNQLYAYKRKVEKKLLKNKKTSSVIYLKSHQKRNPILITTFWAPFLNR